MITECLRGCLHLLKLLLLLLFAEFFRCDVVLLLCLVLSKSVQFFNLLQSIAINGHVRSQIFHIAFAIFVTSLHTFPFSILQQSRPTIVVRFGCLIAVRSLVTAIVSFAA